MIKVLLNSTAVSCYEGILRWAKKEALERAILNVQSVITG